MNTKGFILSFIANRKYRAWHIFAIFFIINLIQGFFTPLLNDEPYYWLYSLNLALGYHGQPPLIAWFIAVGTSLFEGEIGLRLFVIFASSFTPFFLYKIIENENNGQVNTGLFLLLVFSSLFINLYAFLAIPDTLLLFFTVLFFWQYRRFLHIPNTSNALFMGLICAMLLYSKYHGVLVIGFTVLSNPKLLTRKGFYLAAVTALVLLTPYILWQIDNSLPSLTFHFIERGNDFNPKNILSYTGEQLLLTGPLILLLFTILQKTRNSFLFTLKFVSLGVLVFFFISSLRGMVNAYWTLVAWPGMLVLSFLYIEKMKHRTKLVRGILVFGMAFVLLLRINLIFNVYPIPHFNNRNTKEMARQLSLHADDNAVFVNTFIDAAAYGFYSNKQSFAINNTHYKKTQYNYLQQIEDTIQGKAVTLISLNKPEQNSQKISIPKGKTYYLTPIDSFLSYQTTIHIKAELPRSLHAGEKYILPIEVEHKTLRKQEPENFFLILTFFDKESGYFFSNYQFFEEYPEEFEAMEIVAPLKPGSYKTHFSFSPDTSMVFRTFNSRIWFIKVEE